MRYPKCPECKAPSVIGSTTGTKALECLACGLDFDGTPEMVEASKRAEAAYERGLDRIERAEREASIRRERGMAPPAPMRARREPVPSTQIEIFAMLDARAGVTRLRRRAHAWLSRTVAR